MKEPAKTTAVDAACNVMDRAIQRISDLEAQLRQAKENIIPDMETELGMLQAQLRQEREAGAAHKLLAIEVSVKRDFLQYQVAQLQTTVVQQAEGLKMIADSPSIPAEWRRMAAALATCPAPEEPHE